MDKSVERLDLVIRLTNNLENFQNDIKCFVYSEKYNLIVFGCILGYLESYKSKNLSSFKRIKA